MWIFCWFSNFSKSIRMKMMNLFRNKKEIFRKRKELKCQNQNKFYLYKYFSSFFIFCSNDERIQLNWNISKFVEIIIRCWKFLEFDVFALYVILIFWLIDFYVIAKSFRCKKIAKRLNKYTFELIVYF